MTGRHGPPGWPQQVPPADQPGWESQAVGWLLELVPPEYRAYDALTRHPIVLARFAAHHLDAAVSAARTGFAGARTELADVLDAPQIESVLATYEREGRRLVAAARSVSLVRAALEGTRFRARL